MSNGFDDFYAIIPAGGTGTRLWPLSREAKPKFLFDLLGSGRTLIQSTFDRLAAIAGMDHVCISTGERHVDAVEEQMPEVAPEHIFAEPAPRDSTAAIALATAVLARRHGNDIVVGSFAADHVIRGKVAFVDAVRQAVATARAGYVTTIGIAASRPSTAFGYIHEGESLAARVPDAPDAVLVERFVEKPNAATAQAYLNTGEYRWNAGMFVWSIPTVCEQLDKHCPELASFVEHIAESPDPQETIREEFPALTPISIDFALMENADRVLNIEATFDWDDVGSWISVANYLETHNKNTTNTDITVQDASGNIVFSQRGDKHVALLGVENLIVVETADAILIADKNKADEIKKIVNQLPDELR